MTTDLTMDPNALTWAERMNVLPVHAVRAAAALRLPEALVDWMAHDDVGARLGSEPVATLVLVDYLGTLGLVESDADRVRLTAAGQILLQNHPAGLADVVRSGRRYTRAPMAARSRGRSPGASSPTRWARPTCYLLSNVIIVVDDDAAALLLSRVVAVAPRAARIVLLELTNDDTAP